MAVKTQFSVVLLNKPGTLAKVTGALSRAKVNIRAISVADTAEACVVRLLVDAAQKARQALKRGKFTVAESRVVAICAKDEPGALTKLSGKLGKAGVNVDYVYGSACGGDALLVIAADNVAKVEKLIG